MSDPRSPWKVLAVDDDPDVLAVTGLALQGLMVDGRAIALDLCGSAAEARERFAAGRYALAIIDVVMESQHAGLDLVRELREDPEHRLTQIVLRTGQPGIAPEAQVIADYQINDYWSKTELRAQRLRTAVAGLVRGYATSLQLDSERKALEESYECLVQQVGPTGHALLARIAEIGAKRFSPDLVLHLFESSVEHSGSPSDWSVEVIRLPEAREPGGDLPTLHRSREEVLGAHLDCVLRARVQSPDPCWNGETLTISRSVRVGDRVREVALVARQSGGGDVPPFLQRLLGVALISYVGQIERMLRQEHANRAVRHDQVTGRLNRGGLLEWLAELHPPTPDLLVAIVDVDGLRAVNSLFGREGGDRVLEELSTRVSGLDGVLTVGRWGGDELAVILRGGDDPAPLVLSRIRALAAVPVPFGASEIRFGVSIGAACWREGLELWALVEQADMALNRAKALGAGGLLIFDDALQEDIRRMDRIAMALRGADLPRELQVVFQPVVDGEGRAAGAEVLARWTSAELGPVPPSDFIPSASRIGLMPEVTERVFREAARIASAWADDFGRQDWWLSVNVSPELFSDPSFPERLLSWIGTFPPEHLAVEVTEAGILSAQVSEETFERLRSLGVRVLLDDFGTGYSALSYLTNYSFDGIKLDRSFVRGLPGQADAAVTANAVSGLARALGLSLTVEGVETLEQWDFVRSIGGTTFQGYLFSPPIPEREFAVWLRDSERRPA